MATLRRKIEVALLEAAWNDEREVPISLDRAMKAIADRRRARLQIGDAIAKHCSRAVAPAGSISITRRTLCQELLMNT